MLNSSEEIQFIIECLTNYKVKIEALNRVGLFDNAKLFEVFAGEVCRFWFKQRFVNLNKTGPNYPYVDLLSEDGKTYVQVSTVQDVPSKIRGTLKKIANAPEDAFPKITEIYFFVLGNKSVARVKDCQVGNIVFKADRHLVTLEHIIERTRSDTSFRKQLHQVLKQEFNQYTDNEAKLEEAIQTSKFLVCEDIDDLINGEYEIDRKSLIDRIKLDNFKCISIQGSAGSGKTALCKKLLKDEAILLYARAEIFAEANRLSDIWDFDIKKALFYLNKKRAVIFIDALEFIADCRKHKLELLLQLYEFVNQTENVFIVTSCRTADSTAFFKIEAKYNVKVYELTDLTDAEIDLVAARYPVIREMQGLKVYSQLLRSPFYLNLLVSRIHSVEDIRDVNKLRDYIWNNLICLEDRSLPGNLQKTDIRACVRQIVFDRARDFLTGVSKDKLNLDALKILLSEGVVLVTGNNKIRLKYDIYEDICFEKRIDEAFDICKGDYVNFFAEIEQFGRCIYRRFQIWVENKLFARDNQERFLYNLVFSDAIPKVWKKQTMIGIVKSRFCSSFFDNYGEQIVDNSILENIINVVNMFSFETFNINVSESAVYPVLKPVGHGRQCLIQLIAKHKVYEKEIYRQAVVKICSDYANSRYYNKIDSEAAVSVCKILVFFVDKEIQRMKQEDTVPFYFDASYYLTPVYILADFAEDWLKQFWKTVCADFKSSIRTNHEIGQKIIIHLLKKTTPVLALHFSAELCEMAFLFWTFMPDAKVNDFFSSDYQSSRTFDQSEEYGLNENGTRYRYEFKKVFQNQFFVMLANFSINSALDWLIKLTNHAANSYKAKNPQSFFDIAVMIDETGQRKSFIGNTQFWLAGRQDDAVHNLLGDCLYLLKQSIFNLFDHNPLDLQREDFVRLANSWKRNIYSQSNNIMMLTVIEEIGIRYRDMLPGYALELASSIELILIDLKYRGMALAKPLTEGLESNVYRAMGLLNLQNRYVHDEKTVFSLQDYILYLQISGFTDCKESAENILDYLYGIIPNDREHALEYLQIQKMDARNADIRAQKNGKNGYLVQVKPKLTGEAARLSKETDDNSLGTTCACLSVVKKGIAEKIKENSYTEEECLSDIEKIADIKDAAEFGFLAENSYFDLVAYALTHFDFAREKRSALCDAWLAGIGSMLCGKSLAFEHQSLNVLFKQIENDLETDVAIKLKKLMLALLLYQDGNGNIASLSNQLKIYLKGNKRMARALFNTIIALAEDKMNHNLFNAAYMVTQENGCTYVPNRQAPFGNVDRVLCNKGMTGFQSKSDEIIEKYLVNEERLELNKLDMQCYDIGVLCFVSQCGLHLDDVSFRKVMETLVDETILILNTGTDCYSFYNTLQQHEVSGFLSQEILTENAGIVIDILFDNKDYSKYRPITYDFYTSVVNLLLPSFFDGYRDASLRRQCEKTIAVIEKKLKSVTNDGVRQRLSKMLLLSTASYSDWNKLKTEYSYHDKMFLVKVWSKYGHLHLKELLEVIYQMHIQELLPEVLLAVNSCFEQNKDKPDYLRDVIAEEDMVIKLLITKAFLDFNDEIKRDENLIQAFENFLEMLVEYKVEAAGVILDEFRIH